MAVAVSYGLILLINSSRCTMIYDMFVKPFLVPGFLQSAWVYSSSCTALRPGTGVDELTRQPPPAMVPLVLVSARLSTSTEGIACQVVPKSASGTPVMTRPGFRCLSRPLLAHCIAVSNFQRPCTNDRAGRDGCPVLVYCISA